MKKKKRIVIVGSSFAGYTTAVQLAKNLGQKHEIIVIDKSAEFIFTPFLIWYPFGYHDIENGSFDTRPIYEKLGITFIKSLVYGFDLEDRLIYTPDQDIKYDYLVIATGTTPHFTSIKGLNPGKNSWCVYCDFHHSEHTRKAWKNFLNNPGPVVIGAAQWAGYSFAAYEFLFNSLYHLHKHDLLDKIPIHFVTAEPYLTHFGIGGLGQDPDKALTLLENFNVQVHLNAEIHEVKSTDVILEGGTHIPSSFTMIIPPFNGVDAVKTTRKLANEHGLIQVSDQFNHPNYPNLFAAGGSVCIYQKADSKIGLGMPCTHSLSEMMAKAVAQNITAEIDGGNHVTSTTDQFYNLIRKDLEYLGKMIFRDYTNVTEALDFIARGSQDKWANHSMEKYIESSYLDDFMNIKY
ncbi:MAG: FAD-dependent oxidoreductase [Gracilimonas sp.]|nr:FAD-dependent oxidoreductase [Gracilimonas sp.]